MLEKIKKITKLRTKPQQGKGSRIDQNCSQRSNVFPGVRNVLI